MIGEMEGQGRVRMARNNNENTERYFILRKCMIGEGEGGSGDGEGEGGPGGGGTGTGEGEGGGGGGGGEGG